MPDRTRVRLAYGQRTAITASTVTGAQIFRGGSCFDPDYTGGGNQPSDFDLFAAAYFRYRVHGSSIEITATTTSSSSPVRLGLIPTNNTTTVIDIPDLLTNSRSQNCIVGISTGASGARLYDSQRSNTIMGSGGLITDAHTALVSTSPSDDWYWHISAQSYDLSTSVTVIMDIKIVYDVEFFDKALQDTDLLSRVVKLRTLRNEFVAQKCQDKKKAPEESKEKPSASTGAGSKEPEYEMVDLRYVDRPFMTRLVGGVVGRKP